MYLNCIWNIKYFFNVFKYKYKYFSFWKAQIQIQQGNQRWQPRPPRHQVGWDIPLHFDTNPESLRPFVPEIWPNNVFNLSATYDLDLWPKILKIFVSHGVPIRNMYAKFHNDRLRNGWDITLWNFAKTRTNKHTNRHGHYNTSPSPYGGRGKYKYLKKVFKYFQIQILLYLTPCLPTCITGHHVQPWYIHTYIWMVVLVSDLVMRNYLFQYHSH